MNKIEKIKQKRRETAILLGNKCRICDKKFGKGSSFHHIVYRKDEKTHKDFNNVSDYQEYIIGKIEEHPKEFCILCTGHHLLVERLKRFKLERINRLFELVILSKDGDVNKR